MRGRVLKRRRGRVVLPPRCPLWVARWNIRAYSAATIVFTSRSSPSTLSRILTLVGRFIDWPPPPPPPVVAIIQYDCTYSFGNLLSLDKHIEGDERSMEFGERRGTRYTRSALVLAIPNHNPVTMACSAPPSSLSIHTPLLFFYSVLRSIPQLMFTERTRLYSCMLIDKKVSSQACNWHVTGNHDFLPIII